MSIAKLSLRRTLFYLGILKFEKTDITDLNLKTISLSVYGTIIENPTKEKFISNLESRLNFLLRDHLYLDEFTFEFTKEEFENINPKY
jgi:hypothetical protein